jgi:hypothetical protein
MEGGIDLSIEVHHLPKIEKQTSNRRYIEDEKDNSHIHPRNRDLVEFKNRPEAHDGPYGQQED